MIPGRKSPETKRLAAKRVAMKPTHRMSRLMVRLLVVSLSAWSGSLAGGNRLWASQDTEPTAPQAASVDQPTALLAQAPALPAPLTAVRTPRLDIHYRLESVAPGDLARVELWYSLGLNGPWQLYDYDQDRVSPATFVAAEEGAYRFLVVAVDRWGRRSLGPGADSSFSPSNPGPPTADLPAQQAVFVDYTAPRLYLYHPRGGPRELRDQVLAIRWAGFDAHLGPYPVELFYQQHGQETWTTLSRLLPASGEYLWRWPEQLSGAIRVKAVLTDQVGNQDEQVSGVLMLAGPTPPGTNDAQATQGLSNPRGAPLTEPKLAAADEWLRRGNLYCQRLEWHEAVRAFREALTSDPACAAAQVNLAQALLRLGRHEEAQHEYERCLQLHPDQASALFGLAQCQITLGHYDRAARTLRRLVEQDQQDWQGWLLLGDVSAQLGLRAQALASWQRAADDLSPVRTIALDQLHKHQP